MKIKLGFFTDCKKVKNLEEVQDVLEKDLFLLFYYLEITENEQLKTPIIYLTVKNPKWFNNLVVDSLKKIRPEVQVEIFRDFDKTGELFFNSADKMFIYSESSESFETCIKLYTVRKKISKQINFVDLKDLQPHLTKTNSIIKLLFQKNTAENESECESE